MQDLTTGSIPRHIVRMAVPMAAAMLFQTLYYLVDLYFVAQLGDAAIAGVGAAGTLQFIIMAATQVLGVGTTVLISHAAGRKDGDDATRALNQSLLLAGICGVVTLVGGLLFADAYMRRVAADEATVAAGVAYLRWFAPALALQFALITLGSAFRAMGEATPGMIIQITSVLLNIILAPVLVAGWGTGRPLGVAGAGMATFFAVVTAVTVGWIYYLRRDRFARIDVHQIAPMPAVIKRLLAVGLPSGGEFALMFVITGVMYSIIRPFGAPAQAGYGLGTRLMQSIMLPAMAVAFAASPVAGQNMGAGRADRVRETFRSSALLGSGVMFLATLLMQWKADALLALFTKERATVEVGAGFLHVLSWNFVAQGLIFTASGMFQALGNTIPSLISGGVRLAMFLVIAFWITHQPGFTLGQLWWYSVGMVAVQALLSLWFLQREMDRRLTGLVPRGAPPPEAAPVAA